MENNLFAFIICTNNSQYTEECIRYIHELRIPEGYDIDIITIGDAPSKQEGYDAAMQSSNAKYKIYLSEGAFIINENFLSDILNIFSDNHIGMIGMRGTDTLKIDSDSPINYNIGSVYLFDGRCIDKKGCRSADGSYRQAAVVDSFLIVTQYDISWTQYDIDDTCFGIFHSLHMQQAGYQIAVPSQETPWCYYNSEYPGTDSGIKKTLIRGIEAGLYDALIEKAESIKAQNIADSEIYSILQLLEIYLLEENCINCGHSFLFSESSWDSVYAYYNEIRFALTHFSIKGNDERTEWLSEAIKEQVLSKDLIEKISSICAPDTSIIYKELLREQSNEEPFVSVMTCVYNGADFVAETIKSVLNQTYKNIEFIIVDDASTDNSRQVISSFNDSRIKPIFREQNGHVCLAGNDAFQQVTGKYVFITGHDDIFEPDKIERQVAFMEAHPSYVASFSWVDIIDENNIETNDENSDLYKRFCSDNRKSESWIMKLLTHGNFLCAPTACIRMNELTKKELYYNNAFVQTQDYELWLRLLLLGPIYIMQDKLVLYRQFKKIASNLSKATPESYLRTQEEFKLVSYKYIYSMSSENYKKIFCENMRHPNGDDDYVLCEKIMLLYNSDNEYVRPVITDMLCNDRQRQLLETEYDFRPADFYKSLGTKA